MGPNMGKASCKERSDKVREIVVGLGSDEEEEGKQNKSKDGNHEVNFITGRSFLSPQKLFSESK